MEIAGITDAVLLIFNSIHPLPRLWPRAALDPASLQTGLLLKFVSAILKMESEMSVE
jgi:hypothetical protein